jgi:hypothetical protein
MFVHGARWRRSGGAINLFCDPRGGKGPWSHSMKLITPSLSSSYSFKAASTCSTQATTILYRADDDRSFFQWRDLALELIIVLFQGRVRNLSQSAQNHLRTYCRHALTLPLLALDTTCDSTCEWLTASSTASNDPLPSMSASSNISRSIGMTAPALHKITRCHINQSTV